MNDLDVALESMRLGAQEYLVKGQSEHLLLPRAIRYAVERKRLQDVVAPRAPRPSAPTPSRTSSWRCSARAPQPAGADRDRARPRSDEQRRHGARARASIIERQVQHLVRLVDDLLDVSRIARGKLELHRAGRRLGRRRRRRRRDRASRCSTRGGTR